MNTYTKDMVISSVISANPTGIIDFSKGVYTSTGNNNIIQNTNIINKENLKKAQQNEIICTSIEKFENKNINITTYLYPYLNIILFIIIFIIYIYFNIL